MARNRQSAGLAVSKAINANLGTASLCRYGENRAVAKSIARGIVKRAAAHRHHRACGGGETRSARHQRRQTNRGGVASKTRQRRENCCAAAAALKIC
jgi:hypothetical protein